METDFRAVLNVAQSSHLIEINFKFILNYCFIRRTSRADTLRFTIILTTCKCNFNFVDRIIQHWKMIETWKKNSCYFAVAGSYFWDSTDLAEF